MNTEQVNDYLSKLKDNAATKEPITPEEPDGTPEAPSEVTESETKVEETKGVEQKQVEDKADDKAEEPKAEVDKAEPEEPETKTEVKDQTKVEEPKKQSTRDYAFERLKRREKQTREENRKYQERIKELEAQLEQGKDLKAEHFLDKDGKPDPTSYVNWKFKERDMQDEIKELQRQAYESQLQADIEEDRIRVENCFQDEKEREDYNNLIARNGQAFYNAVTDADPQGVVFKYLSTMPEYPVVLRELMTDSKLLGYAFRSTDPDALKKNIASIADQILDRRHKPISTPKEEPKVEPKKELPVIGKQINSTPGTGNVPHDRNYWNRYLREHPRG